MDWTSGACYPFCRECTSSSVAALVRSPRVVLGIGTRFVRWWGRKCHRCGSVTRIRFFGIYGIPLLPLSRRYRMITLRSDVGERTYIAREMRRYAVDPSVADGRREAAARYLVSVAGHPELMDERHVRADRLWAEGDVAGALPLYEMTLAEHERALGAYHPGALVLCHQVARAHAERNQVAEAMSLLDRVFRHRQRVLGPQHPDTVEAFVDYVDIATIATTRMSVRFIYQAVVADLERTLGADHLRTLRARIGLGIGWLVEGRKDERHLFLTRRFDDSNRNLRSHGREDEAVQCLERCFDDSIRILGSHHPDVDLVREDLLWACAEAHASPNIPHIEQAVRVRTRFLGANHPDTLTSQNRLALGYRETARLAEAIAIWRSIQEQDVEPLAREAEQHLRDVARHQR